MSVWSNCKSHFFQSIWLLAKKLTNLTKILTNLAINNSINPTFDWSRVKIFVLLGTFKMVKFFSQSSAVDGWQCDQMVRLICSMFANLQHCKFSQKQNNFAKVFWSGCQILNKPLRNGQRLIQIFEGGKISPNLVTLMDDRLC